MNIFDLWDFGDAGTSEARFRNAVTEAASDVDRAVALTQVARAQGLQGKFEAARATLAEADTLLPASGTGRAQYWVELGRVENSSGNPKAAMPHFQRALDLAQAADDEYLAVDASHMLAIAAPVDMQPHYAEAALALAKDATDDRARRWIGPIVNNLGWSYMDSKQPEKALPYFEESLAFRVAQGDDAPIRIARYALGCALRACGRLDEAFATQREALAMGGSVGYIEEEIAECLYALGRVEEARPFFAEAHEKLSANADLAASEPARLARILARAT